VRPIDGQGSVRQFKELHSTLGPGGKGTIEMLSLSQAGSKPMTAIGGTSKPTPAIDTGLTHILRDDGTQVPAYTSAATDGGAGIVVIQEWWGVNEQIKATASNIASACGARVCIPDLYRSKVAYEAAEAHHLMSGLDWPGAIDDVKACAAWLKANGCSKVVVVGFCMGGALSLGSAVQLGEVDACIAFYGWNKQLGDVSTMSKPVQCHFGDQDDIAGFSDVAASTELEALLQQSGCPLEFYRYPTQGHGFMNGTDWGKEMQVKLGRPSVEEAEIEKAMSRVKAFVDKYAK